MAIIYTGNMHKRKRSIFILPTKMVDSSETWSIPLRRQILRWRSSCFGRNTLPYTTVACCVLTGMCYIIGGSFSRMNGMHKPRMTCWERSTKCGNQNYKSNRRIELSEREIYFLHNPKPSLSYYDEDDPTFTFKEGDCVAMHDWQLKSFPTCTSMHEVDMTRMGEVTKLINHGVYRIVWMVHDFDGTGLALKTLRFIDVFTENMFDKHRRDALAYERLTSSSNVVDIYCHCANSGIFELGQQGDLEQITDYFRDDNFAKMTKLDRLRTAVQVAAGVADLHNSEKDGQAAIAHIDIEPDQFILLNGKFKLNDFNRCRFLKVNRKTKEICGYGIANIDGLWQAPEVYRKDPQNEKVDIFAIGHVIFILLTGSDPFRIALDGDRKRERAAKYAIGKGGTLFAEISTSGTMGPLQFVEENEERKNDHYNGHADNRTILVESGRPPLPPGIKESTDPIDMALRVALDMCYTHDISRRPSAQAVFQHLFDSLNLVESKGKGLEFD